MTNNFIEAIAPLYISAVKKCNTPLLPSILIAQACLESNYGQSTLAREANNYGGIKASAPWVGKPYYKDSLEDDGKGNLNMQNSGFARFGSLQEFVEYHANFCQNTEYRKKYYAKALSGKTFQEQAQGLQGTYATDTRYASKLIELVNKYNLTQYDNMQGERKDEKVTEVKESKGAVNSMKMYEFKQKITRANMEGSMPKSNVKYLVFHFVGAAGQALANANYFYDVDRSASAHLFIDPKEIYQVVPFDRVAWHVGKIA